MAIIDNLISYWKLDETSGTVLDAHGSNNGTNHGATPNVSGKINTAYSFDGSDDYIELSEIPFTGSGNFSIFAWIKTSDSGNRITIINFGTTGISYNQELYLYKGTDDKLHFDLRNVPGPISAETINDNSWHHVGVTNTGGTIQLWVDGSPSGSSMSMSPNITSGDQSIGVAEATSYPSAYWSGEIDEVGIWTRALSSDEITELYNNGNGLAYPFTNMKINIGDAWKDVVGMKINIGGAWKDVESVKINVGGAWKTVY